MRHINNTIYILIANILALFVIPEFSYCQNYLDKIVIDAGHGGKDPGASGKYSREKDVVLKVALQTGSELKKLHPDIEIIYTRKTDIFIPLKERAEIANRANADLFISIHCNSNSNSQPRGSETYVMGLHKSEANLDVAKTENAAILFEEDYKKNYDGFDPTSDESHIIFNFFQNSFLAQNLDLASKVQSKFSVYTHLRNRGVKQAGFWVLYKTTMPGVLIETGFLSNSEDEKFLNSKDGQTQLSKAIANAINDYKKEHDIREKLKIEHTKTETQKKEEIVSDDPAIEISEENAKEENIKNEVAKNPKKEDAHPKDIPVQKPKIKQQKATYSVQFLSLSKDKELKGADYEKIQPISTYHHKSMYRYITGKTEYYEEGLKLQTKVRKLGFKDAFLVAFYLDKRITLSEAKKINNEN